MRWSVSRASVEDAGDWRALRDELWPDAAAVQATEIAQMLERVDQAAFIARDVAGQVAGFAEAALRYDYVNGCETSPVGFLEGIYVRPPYRRQGVARALTEAVAAWTLAQGCRELASDATTDNLDSHRMHAALGFAETERVVYFRRVLKE